MTEQIRADEGRPGTPFTSIMAFRQMIGLGNSKVYELINDGTICTLKVGSRRLVDVVPSVAALRRRFGSAQSGQGGEGGALAKAPRAAPSPKPRAATTAERRRSAPAETATT